MMIDWLGRMNNNIYTFDFCERAARRYFKLLHLRTAFSFQQRYNQSPTLLVINVANFPRASTSCLLQYCKTAPLGQLRFPETKQLVYGFVWTWIYLSTTVSVVGSESRSRIRAIWETKLSLVILCVYYADYSNRKACYVFSLTNLQNKVNRRIQFQPMRPSIVVTTFRSMFHIYIAVLYLGLWPTLTWLSY
jgi:hypothetical protein